MLDLFGKAILDFQTNNNPENIITQTSISDSDEMNIAYLFRDFNKMPKLEQKALQLANGKVLDVGCGAGSHSLYLSETKKLEVLSIDISENAIKTCELRGVKNAKAINILDLDANVEKFDTILLLMNGTGIFETISKTKKYFDKLKSLLNKNGQILIDSSDLIYMYDEDEIEEIKNSEKYYGEIDFTIQYKNEPEKPIPWLYLDFPLLEKLALKSGFVCKKLIEGKNFDYLAQITLLDLNKEFSTL